jgi:hypothetical protein
MLWYLEQCYGGVIECCAGSETHSDTSCLSSKGGGSDSFHRILVRKVSGGCGRPTAVAKRYSTRLLVQASQRKAVQLMLQYVVFGGCGMFL